MASSSSSSSYPPVVPQHCSNVPVLFELLRGEEEQCRVWLRDEMKQISDPLIDSLFGRLIMLSSSSAVPHSRLNVSELCELLEGEKVETRMVLRSEMDRLVNTLFEKLTNKLRTNTDLNRSEDGGERAQVVDTLDRVESHNAESHQPSTSSFNPVPHQQHSSGDEMELNTVEMFEIKEEVEDGEETRIIDIAGLAEDNQSGDDDGSRSVENAPMDWVKQEIKEEFVDGQMMVLSYLKKEEDGDETRIIDIAGLAEDNQSGGGQSPSGENAITEATQQMDCNEPEFKGEFDFGQEIEIKQEDDEDESTKSGEMMKIKKEEEEEDSETQINDIEGLPEDNQSGDDDGSRSVDNAPMDWVKREIKEGEEDEEMMDIEENEEVGDGQTRVTDTEELVTNECANEESRSVEDAQIGTTPPQLTRQSQANMSKSARHDKRKQNVPQARNELTNRDNQHVQEDDAGEGTSRPVKRPRQSRPTASSTEQKQIITHTLQCPQVDCLKMIAKDEFNLHMWDKHSIGQHRCMVKDCKQSFDKQNNMSEHLAQSHQHTAELHCDKCDHLFTTYKQLSDHYYQHHQLGDFQCSFPACTFTGEHRKIVHSHYTNRHRRTFTCDHPGCSYQTPKASDLKAHQRIHLNIKPYRCKWLHCNYASTRGPDTIRHIRQVHLAPNPNSVPNGAQPSNPGDYLEVVHELLS